MLFLALVWFELEARDFYDNKNNGFCFNLSTAFDAELPRYGDTWYCLNEKYYYVFNYRTISKTFMGIGVLSLGGSI